MWDLQNNGGSVAATTERILGGGGGGGRGLDVVSFSFSFLGPRREAARGGGEQTLQQ